MESSDNKDKSPESYISNQDTLISLKAIQWQIISFDECLKIRGT